MKKASNRNVYSKTKQSQEFYKLTLYGRQFTVCWCRRCAEETEDGKALERTTSSVYPSKMKLKVAITGTELAFIDDLLLPHPVAVVIKVSRVMCLQQS